MPPMERPPVSPQVQAQMGPPSAGGGPGFGQGMAAAQAEKSPVETAVATAEKILMGVADDAFRPYATKAIATLKVGLAMSQQKGPQSQPGGMGAPPPPGPMGPGPQSQMPVPPVAGQMAG